MPALPDVPNVARVTMVGTIGQDLDVVNRFYRKFSGSSYGDTDATAFAADVAAAYNAHMLPILSVGYELIKVITEDLTSDVGSTGEWDGAHAGAVGGAMLPADSCLVIKAKIDRRYRGGHPRQYVGGMPSTMLSTPQEIDPTQAAAIVAAYTAFRAACGSSLPSGNQPVTDVNVSYFHGFTNHLYPSGRYRAIPSLRPTPVVDQIASFALNPKLGSQRRRLLQSL